MFLYEVNLYIKKDSFNDFLPWLDAHIKEMLSFPGFKAAETWKRDVTHPPPASAPEGPLVWLTVHYRLQSREHFETYLSTQASRMRADGLKHFAGCFSADRRCYEHLSRHDT